MSDIVGVHGIFNYSYFVQAGNDPKAAAEGISKDWSGWLARSLGLFDTNVPVPDRFPVAYYADCLNRGIPMGAARPEMLEPEAQRIFVDWVGQIRARDYPASDVQVAEGGRVLRLLVRQPAAYLVSRHGKLALDLITRLSAEMATYFGDEHHGRRLTARARLAATLREYRPRVLLAHSLGSVVAYEVLCAEPDLNVELLVTLGSPLAVPRIVYERLDPAPQGRPAGVHTWVNVADRADPVALPIGGLGGFFDGVEDREIAMRPFDPHTAKGYLRSVQIAEIIAPYLGRNPLRTLP